MLKNKSLIAPSDLSLEEIEELLALAERIILNPANFSDVCRGKILASLFYEPSTRTKFSFDAAMLRLGGSTLGFSDPNTSSTAKGETIADSARTVGQYADLIVVRSPKEERQTHDRYAGCPVVIAGDGGHHHPTQTLTDLLTIRHYKGGFDGLTVGVCGDLKFGRTIHSLTTCLARYENVRFLFISPEELSMPAFVKEELDINGVSYEETTSLEGCIGRLDVLYMSRVQRDASSARKNTR